MVYFKSIALAVAYSALAAVAGPIAIRGDYETQPSYNGEQYPYPGYPVYPYPPAHLVYNYPEHQQPVYHRPDYEIPEHHHYKPQLQEYRELEDEHRDNGDSEHRYGHPEHYAHYPQQPYYGHPAPYYPAPYPSAGYPYPHPSYPGYPQGFRVPEIGGEWPREITVLPDGSIPEFEGVSIEIFKAFPQFHKLRHGVERHSEEHHEPEHYKYDEGSDSYEQYERYEEPESRCESGHCEEREERYEEAERYEEPEHHEEPRCESGHCEEREERYEEAERYEEPEHHEEPSYVHRPDSIIPESEIRCFFDDYAPGCKKHGQARPEKQVNGNFNQNTNINTNTNVNYNDNKSQDTAVAYGPSHSEDSYGRHEFDKCAFFNDKLKLVRRGCSDGSCGSEEPKEEPHHLSSFPLASYQVVPVHAVPASENVSENRNVNENTSINTNSNSNNAESQGYEQGGREYSAQDLIDCFFRDGEYHYR